MKVTGTTVEGRAEPPPQSSASDFGKNLHKAHAPAAIQTSHSTTRSSQHNRVADTRSEVASHKSHTGDKAYEPFPPASPPARKIKIRLDKPAGLSFEDDSTPGSDTDLGGAKELDLHFTVTEPDASGRGAERDREPAIPGADPEP